MLIGEFYFLVFLYTLLLFYCYHLSNQKMSGCKNVVAIALENMQKVVQNSALEG